MLLKKSPASRKHSSLYNRYADLVTTSRKTETNKHQLERHRSKETKKQTLQRHRSKEPKEHNLQRHRSKEPKEHKLERHTKKQRSRNCQDTEAKKQRSNQTKIRIIKEFLPYPSLHTPYALFLNVHSSPFAFEKMTTSVRIL